MLCITQLTLTLWFFFQWRLSVHVCTALHLCCTELTSLDSLAVVFFQSGNSVRANASSSKVDSRRCCRMQEHKFMTCLDCRWQLHPLRAYSVHASSCSCVSKFLSLCCQRVQGKKGQAQPLINVAINCGDMWWQMQILNLLNIAGTCWNMFWTS
jgi:hypothetical protein